MIICLDYTCKAQRPYKSVWKVEQELCLFWSKSQTLLHLRQITPHDLKAGSWKRQERKNHPKSCRIWKSSDPLIGNSQPVATLKTTFDIFLGSDIIRFSSVCQHTRRPNKHFNHFSVCKMQMLLLNSLQIGSHGNHSEVWNLANIFLFKLNRIYRLHLSSTLHSGLSPKVGQVKKNLFGLTVCFVERRFARSVDSTAFVF